MTASEFTEFALTLFEENPTERFGDKLFSYAGGRLNLGDEETSIALVKAVSLKCPTLRKQCSTFLNTVNKKRLQGIPAEVSLYKGQNKRAEIRRVLTLEKIQQSLAQAKGLYEKSQYEKAAEILLTILPSKSQKLERVKEQNEALYLFANCFSKMNRFEELRDVLFGFYKREGPLTRAEVKAVLEQGRGSTIEDEEFDKYYRSYVRARGLTRIINREFPGSKPRGLRKEDSSVLYNTDATSTGKPKRKRHP